MRVRPRVGLLTLPSVRDHLAMRLGATSPIDLLGAVAKVIVVDVALTVNDQNVEPRNRAELFSRDYETRASPSMLTGRKSIETTWLGRRTAVCIGVEIVE